MTNPKRIYHFSVVIPQEGVITIAAETEEQARQYVEKSFEARKLMGATIISVADRQEIEDFKNETQEQIDNLVKNIEETMKLNDIQEAANKRKVN